MFDNLFKKNRYLTVNSHSTTEPKKVQEQKPFIPDGMWVKCDSCGNVIYKKDLEEHQMTCEHCKTHFKLSSQDRIKLTLDAGTFIEYDRNMKSVNPLDYPGYEEKIDGLSAQTDLNEAVITGEGKINGERTVIAVMDSRFMMGSMGSVVGEKITRAVENATKQRLPIIIFTASGGARMQEGMFSLMQMAKVSAALARHDEEGLVYITVLTNPTTGGVTASFAMLGDIILAEPGALIGFAGRRVIEQTIKQALPEGFQTAEFLLEHGFIDDVVPRNKLKDMLGQLLAFHKRR